MTSNTVGVSSSKGILEKELSRQEFIMYLGVLFLALTGISSIFKGITESNLLRQNKITQKGFGKGAYGG